MNIFRRKSFLYFFLIFAENINCGYTLDPPHRGQNGNHARFMVVFVTCKNDEYSIKNEATRALTKLSS